MLKHAYQIYFNYIPATSSTQALLYYGTAGVDKGAGVDLFYPGAPLLRRCRGRGGSATFWVVLYGPILWFGDIVLKLWIRRSDLDPLK